MIHYISKLQQLLQNESLAAKIGFDTAENGRSKFRATNTDQPPTTPLPHPHPNSLPRPCSFVSGQIGSIVFSLPPGQVHIDGHGKPCNRLLAASRGTHHGPRPAILDRANFGDQT